MQLSIADAIDLVVRALARAGMRPHAARIVADHLVDANLCGHEFSSLPRVLAIVEELRKKPPPGEIRVVREDHSTAVIDGGDNVAYVVSIAAIDKAIEICRKNGVAIVTANNTWFSGRCGFYVGRTARQRARCRGAAAGYSRRERHGYRRRGPLRPFLPDGRSGEADAGRRVPVARVRIQAGDRQKPAVGGNTADARAGRRQPAT